MRAVLDFFAGADEGGEVAAGSRVGAEVMMGVVSEVVALEAVCADRVVGVAVGGGTTVLDGVVEVVVKELVLAVRK